MVEGLCDCCGVWGVNWGEVLGMGMLYVMLSLLSELVLVLIGMGMRCG